MPTTISLRRRLAIAFAVAVVFVSSSASAGPFSRLVVFGDSLSDVGNIASATFGTFPGPSYYENRFSNGPVFTEGLSVGLGLGPTVRSTAGGDNFAYGGAQTSGTGGFNGLFIRDVDEQVDQYLDTRTLDPASLFLMFSGANDLVGGQTNVNVPVNSLADDIGRLVAAGARQFLILDLPLLGNVPRFNGNATNVATYNNRTSQFNVALTTALDTLAAANPQLIFFRLDVAALFDEALANPAAFGLTNVTTAAEPGLSPGDSSYDENQIAPNPNEYLFWDDLHPTATVHEILAQRATNLVELPGDYNNDAIVDSADYTIWRDALGRTGSGVAADGVGNSSVDQRDYGVWVKYFEQTAAAHAPVDAVPEPSAAMLLILMTCGFLCAGRSTR